MPDKGIVSLTDILESLSGLLYAENYVFVTIKSSQLKTLRLDEVFAVINEEEAATLIIETSKKENWTKEALPEFARITLNVHSALHAVGLTAAVSTALAKAAISCNVLAGYYHDHIFVQKDKAKEALNIINAL